jgi:hypothetical protein
MTTIAAPRGQKGQQVQRQAASELRTAVARDPSSKVKGAVAAGCYAFQWPSCHAGDPAQTWFSDAAGVIIMAKPPTKCRSNDATAAGQPARQ